MSSADDSNSELLGEEDDKQIVEPCPKRRRRGVTVDTHVECEVLQNELQITSRFGVGRCDAVLARQLLVNILEEMKANANGKERRIVVHRDSMLRDVIKAFTTMTANTARNTPKVAFVDLHGQEENGIDACGLSEELVELILNKIRQGDGVSFEQGASGKLLPGSWDDVEWFAVFLCWCVVHDFQLPPIFPSVFFEILAGEHLCESNWHADHAESAVAELQEWDPETAGHYARYLQNPQQVADLDFSMADFLEDAAQAPACQACGESMAAGDIDSLPTWKDTSSLENKDHYECCGCGSIVQRCAQLWVCTSEQCWYGAPLCFQCFPAPDELASLEQRQLDGHTLREAISRKCFHKLVGCRRYALRVFRYHFFLKSTLRHDVGQQAYSTSALEAALLALGGTALCRYMTAEEHTTKALVQALKFHKHVPLATRRHLKKFLRKASMYEQLAFLRFVTSRSVLPREKRISVLFVPSDVARLPQTRTCFLQLQLSTCPDYTAFETLMREAIRCQSFHRDES